MLEDRTPFEGPRVFEFALLGTCVLAFDTSGTLPPGFTGFELTDDGTASHGTKVTYVASAMT
jgi:hypothetical protein